MNELSQHWMIDQQRLFCAGHLSGLNRVEQYDKLRVRDLCVRGNIAAKHIAKMEEFEFSTASDSLLGFLCDLKEEVFCPPKRSYLNVSLVEQHQLAKVELSKRQDSAVSGPSKGNKSEASVLLNHGAFLLRDEKITLTSILKWLKWNSPSIESIAARLLEDLGSISVEESKKLATSLQVARGSAQAPHQRVEAIDCVHDFIAQRLRDNPSGAQSSSNINRSSSAWWTRLCSEWRSAQYFWPLFVGDPSGFPFGMSLPISLGLLPGGASCVDLKPFPKNMKLSDDWCHSFDVGLQAGKVMWKSQNGRLLLHAPERMHQKLSADLLVDHSIADEIVSVMTYDQENPFPISGRSAEAYWAQASLSLLLDAGGPPSGVATGKIEDVRGALRVKPVGGLEEKLFYANSFGFSRVVLPGEDRKLLGREEFEDEPGEAQEEHQGVDDVDSYLRFRKKIEALGLARQIEVNFCPEARSAADALQTRGWRRASFFRLPETQADFGYHLHRLHVADAPPEESASDTQLIKKPWRSEEDAALARFDDLLLGDEPHAIRHIARVELDKALDEIRADTRDEKGRMSLPPSAEAAVGKWLAWQDHLRRRGTAGLVDRRRSGLGVFALKTQPGDYEYRLWAITSEELDATPEWHTSFRWADKRLAGERLAKLLNNSHLDPDISRTAPPDIVVIFDEARFTGPRPIVVPFDHDFSADWRPILDPCWDKSDVTTKPFPLQETLENVKQSVLGVRSRHLPADSNRNTRIIIIQGPPSAQQPEHRTKVRVPNELRESLQRLAVFRFGFRAQAAFSLLNYQEETPISFRAVRNILSNLVRGKFLGYTRGAFFLKPQFRKVLASSPYLEDANFHMQAAFALCPLLKPADTFVAENRDKSLRTENFQEASWHLSEAIRILPPKDKAIRKIADDAKKSIALISRIADWDSFNELQRRGGELSKDAVELGRELLAVEESVAMADGRKLEIYGHRTGKLLDAIARYGHQQHNKRRRKKKKNADLRQFDANIANLIEECHHLFRSHSGQHYSTPLRAQRRLAAHYLAAMDRLGGEADEYAHVILYDLLREIDEESYLEGSLEKFLDTYLPPMWWKWRIYNESNQNQRRHWCRLAARSEVLKAKHTDWDHKFEEPWPAFLYNLTNDCSDLELSEMLRLWWVARGVEPYKRAKYRDVVLGLNQVWIPYEHKTRTYLELLMIGGSNLINRVANGELSEEIEAYALSYLSEVNLADPILAFNLVSDWKNAGGRGGSGPFDLSDWVEKPDKTKQRRQFVGKLLENPGSWAAMMRETQGKALLARAHYWRREMRKGHEGAMQLSEARHRISWSELDNNKRKWMVRGWRMAIERAQELDRSAYGRDAVEMRKIVRWVSTNLGEALTDQPDS